MRTPSVSSNAAMPRPHSPTMPRLHQTGTISSSSHGEAAGPAMGTTRATLIRSKAVALAVKIPAPTAYPGHTMGPVRAGTPVLPPLATTLVTAAMTGELDPPGRERATRPGPMEWTTHRTTTSCLHRESTVENLLESM